MFRSGSGEMRCHSYNEMPPCWAHASPRNYWAFFKPIYLFVRTTERQTRRESFYPLDHASDAHSGSQDKARNGKLHPGLPCGWQEGNSLSHPPAALQELGAEQALEPRFSDMGSPSSVFPLGQPPALKAIHMSNIYNMLYSTFIPKTFLFLI